MVGPDSWHGCHHQNAPRHEMCMCIFGQKPPRERMIYTSAQALVDGYSSQEPVKHYTRSHRLGGSVKSWPSDRQRHFSMQNQMSLGCHSLRKNKSCGEQHGDSGTKPGCHHSWVMAGANTRGLSLVEAVVCGLPTDFPTCWWGTGMPVRAGIAN